MAKKEMPAEEYSATVHTPASGVASNRLYMKVLEELAGENKSTMRVHELPTFYSLSTGAVAFFDPLLQPPVLVISAKSSALDASVRLVYEATCKELNDAGPPYRHLAVQPGEKEIPAFLEFMRELMKTASPYNTAVILETAYRPKQSLVEFKRECGIKDPLRKHLQDYFDIRRLDEKHKGGKSRKKSKKSAEVSAAKESDSEED